MTDQQDWQPPYEGESVKFRVISEEDEASILCDECLEFLAHHLIKPSLQEILKIVGEHIKEEHEPPNELAASI